MIAIARQMHSLVRALIQALVLALCFSGVAQANTLVRISTSFGDFTLELFDEAAPVTVQNFLNYVQRGDYNGSYFHRLSKDFVLQGGGFRFQPYMGAVAINTDAHHVDHAPMFSGCRGKLPFQPNGGGIDEVHRRPLR